MEINRNFPTTSQAYATVNLPAEMWSVHELWKGSRGAGGTCYFGASPLAYTRLAQFFGYRPLVFDKAMVNMFFVHANVIGSTKPAASTNRDPDVLDADFSLDSAARALYKATGSRGSLPIHEPCPYMMWLQIPPGTDFVAPDFESQLNAVVLAERLSPEGKRVFRQAQVQGAKALQTAIAKRGWTHPEP